MSGELDLQRFRDRHPESTLGVGGATWRYIRGGQGRVPCLFLHGVMGDAYDAAYLMQPLEEEVRFVAPTLPPLRNLREMVEGLEAILDREGMRQAVVIGGSYGGLMAQSFFHRCRDRVAHLVLFDTAPPDRHVGRRNAYNQFVWKWLPMGLIRRLSRWRLGRLLRATGPVDARGAALLAHAAARLDEKIARVDRASLASQVALANEMFTQDPIDSVDLRGWPGRILIIGPDDHPQLARARVGVEKIFPTAEVLRIRGAGHLGSVLQRDRYLEAIRRLMAV